MREQRIHRRKPHKTCAVSDFTGDESALIDVELIDLIATCDSALQAIIAARAPLGRAAAAAIAEVGSVEACLIAIENPYADVTPSSIARIADRFGHLGAIREALFARFDLPIAVRQSLVRQLSNALADFVAERNWLPRDRVEEVGREAISGLSNRR